MPKKSREQKRVDKTRARAKKHQQRHAKRSSPALRSLLGGFAFGDVPTAPPGFRPLPMTQAILEFAAPLLAYVDQGTVQDPNDALHIGMQLWNYTLPHAPVSQKPARTAIVDTMQTTLQMDRQEADALFEGMIARKADLFPEEIQPAGSVTLFMRKEVEYLITPFAESQLHLSDEIVPPDDDDDTFVKALEELDARIDFGEDYGEWESDNHIEGSSSERYS